MSAGRLQQILSSCRRRQLVVAFVRHLAISWAVSVMLLAGLTFARPGVLSVFYQRATFALLAGFTGAAVLTWVRRPSIRRTAIELDRRLAVDDSFVAALDSLKASLPVTSLVIRYAVNRFGSAKPRDVFPVNAGVPIVVLMVAVVTALGVAVWRQSPVQVQRPDGFVMGGGSPLASAGDNPVESSSGAAPASQFSERGRQAPADVHADATQRQAGARSEDRAYAPESATDSVTSSDVRPQPDTSRQSDPRRAVRARDSRTGPSSATLNSSLVTDGAAPALARPGNGRGAAGGERGVGATAIGNPDLTGGQSGGVREGSLLDVGEPSGSVRHASGSGVDGRRRADPASPAAASTGWRNTDVPPDLRTYVREYFSALERQERR
jgi:hypothetical protein